MERSEYGYLMGDLIWRKTKAGLLSVPLMMRDGTWLLFLFLTILFACELCFPFRGQAQSFSETGLFYFTGTAIPIRKALFREFMRGEGYGPTLKAGPIRLRPHLGIAQVYTDNAFRRNKSRQGDFLTTIAPGLQALLPFGGGKHSVLLDYRATKFHYHKFSENNALAQDAQGRLSLNFSGGITVDLQGGHIEGFDARGSALDIQQAKVTKWNTNSFLGQVEYSGRATGIRLRTTYQDLHYKNNGQGPRRDYTLALADLTFLANVTPTTSALLGVQLSTRKYDQNTQLDSFGYGVFTGVRMAPTRQLSGEINIGYILLNFDNAPLPKDQSVSQEFIDKGLSRGADQQKSVFLRGKLDWNPTSRLSFSVAPFRTIEQAPIFNAGTFIGTGVDLYGRQAFTDRFALRGSFLFQNIDYDSGRTDDQFLWRIGPEYRAVKWLGFRLDYLFEKRNSNQSNFTYYSNTIMLSIQGVL